MSTTTDAVPRPPVTQRVSARYRRVLGIYHRARPYIDRHISDRPARLAALRREFYSDLWQKAARDIGAKLAPWQSGYLRLKRDGLTTVVDLSRVMLDDHVTLSIMGNKLLTYDLLREMGYPLPHFAAYGLATMGQALGFLAAASGPVVVKPAAGTGGGSGVTTGITSAKALAQASRLAARYSEHLIVEQQMAGTSYRLLYLDGRFIDAVRRDRPSVIGDGQHTIRQLVRRENQARLGMRPMTALSALTIDGDCRNWLALNGLGPGHRPAAGERVVVKQAVNQNSARDNHNVRDIIHDDVIESGSRLVSALGVCLAGVDVMSTDIGVPLAHKQTTFSEINTTPGLHHHYLISQPGEAAPVAELVLDHIFATGRGVMRL